MSASIHSANVPASAAALRAAKIFHHFFHPAQYGVAQPFLRWQIQNVPYFIQFFLYPHVSGVVPKVLGIMTGL